MNKKLIAKQKEKREAREKREQELADHRYKIKQLIEKKNGK